MKLVTLLGCPTSPPADMEACMQKADPQQISLNQFNVLGQPSFFEAPFAPHVDGDFLPDKVEVGVCVCVKTSYRHLTTLT